MKKQNGSVLISIIVILAVIVGVVAWIISYANTAVGYEQNINKFDKASMVTLSTYTLKFKEAAQVPDMYVESLRTVIKDTFSGRYGADGSKATMQWISENNLPFDASMYTKIQNIIVAGRDEFKLSQDRKLEICTDYDILTKKPISKTILGFLGYPSDDVANKCEVILDQSTVDTFKTKIAEPLKL